MAEVSDRAEFLEHLLRPKDKERSYVEMSRGLAASAVDKRAADAAGSPRAAVIEWARHFAVRPSRSPARGGVTRLEGHVRIGGRGSQRSLDQPLDEAIPMPKD